MATVSALNRFNKPHDREGDPVRHPASILVVDDEPGMRNFLQRGLARYCALIEAADSVEAAEELVRRCHFDVLLVDNRLSGLSGVEWLEALRAQGSRADVILMTAYADLQTAIAALRGGAADFILKPFRMEQMWSAVRRCLERQQMARAHMDVIRQPSAQQSATNPGGVASGVLGTGYPAEWNMVQVEKDHILRVLAAVKNNKSEAARRLGLSRKTLERKLQAWARQE